ncbi:hypothetical protein CEXT_343481, partial [Caerostris extrusa]
LKDADSWIDMKPDVPLHYKIISQRNEQYIVKLEDNGLLLFSRNATGAVAVSTK